MKKQPIHRGGVLGDIDWDRWSVVLCKPDSVQCGLVDEVLERVSRVAHVSGRRRVTVADWQVHVHYWDLLVDADWFDRDIPTCLREMYVGKQVTVALAHGPTGTAGRVRELLGNFDPAYAAPGTIRGDLGSDSLAAATAEGRLVNNLVHSSDNPTAACRDFGTWYGANRHLLLDRASSTVPRPTRSGRPPSH